VVLNQMETSSYYSIFMASSQQQGAESN